MSLLFKVFTHTFGYFPFHKIFLCSANDNFSLNMKLRQLMVSSTIGLLIQSNDNMKRL